MNKLVHPLEPSCSGLVFYFVFIKVCALISYFFGIWLPRKHMLVNFHQEKYVVIIIPCWWLFYSVPLFFLFFLSFFLFFFFLAFPNISTVGRFLQGQRGYHWNCALAFFCHGAEHTYSNFSVHQVSDFVSEWSFWACHADILATFRSR